MLISGSSGPMQLHCTLGLGMILSSLYQKQLNEIAGNHGSNIMLTSLSVLEKAVFTDDAVDGAIIGYGLALSSLLIHDSRKDSQVHALSTRKNILEYCSKLTQSDLATVSGQAMWYTLVCVTMSGMLSGFVEGEDVYSCFMLLKEKVHACQQVIIRVLNNK